MNDPGQNIFATNRVSLLVPAQNLEDDDRYGWFALALQGNTRSVGEIAEDAEVAIQKALEAANILFDEGFLEVEDKMKYLAIGIKLTDDQQLLTWSIEVETTDHSEIEKLLANHNENGEPEQVILVAKSDADPSPIVRDHWSVYYQVRDEPESKTVEVLIMNRKGMGSHTQTAEFTTFEALKSLVDELVEEVPFHKVTVELSASWETTPEENEKLRKIEGE